MLPSIDVHGQFVIEPITILDKKLVKRNNATVVKVLVQWSNTLPDQMLRRRTRLIYMPDFPISILVDKSYFKNANIVKELVGVSY